MKSEILLQQLENLSMVKIFDDVFDCGFTTFIIFLTGLKHFQYGEKVELYGNYVERKL
jgi:hypothetical protein